MIYQKGRRDLLDWLKKQLIGPSSGENLLRGSPLDRYPTGILFPIMRDEEGIDPASVSDDDDDTESLGDDTTAGSDAQPATKRRRYMPPSSCRLRQLGSHSSFNQNSAALLIGVMEVR